MIQNKDFHFHDKMAGTHINSNNKMSTAISHLRRAHPNGKGKTNEAVAETVAERTSGGARSRTKKSAF